MQVWTPAWWDVDPKQFIFQHFPEPDAKWQLLGDAAMTKEAWADAAWTHSAFFSNSMTILSHPDVRIAHNDHAAPLCIRFGCPPSTTCMTTAKHSSRGGKEVVVKAASLIQRDGDDPGVLQVFAQFAKAGTYVCERGERGERG